jgi:hypothetical protein
LSVTKVPHWLPHAAALLGVQQPPSARHTWLESRQVLRNPSKPQPTAWLQLLVAVPHCRLPQACSVDSGWHCVDPHVPQSTVFPQLSVVWPQRPVHQSGSLWHTQV